MNNIRTIEIILYSILAFTAAAFTAATVIFTVIISKRQRRLRYSITLVELRGNKLLYWIVNVIALAVIAECVYYIINPQGILLRALINDFGLGPLGIRITMGLLALIALDALTLGLVLTFSKCAVVDKGIYTPVRFLDWHHVYDFHFVQGKNQVIVSSDSNGPLTLDGTSPPLKYRAADYDKLKYILDKNKNKFVPRY